MQNIQQSAVTRQEADVSQFPCYNDTKLKRPNTARVSVVPERNNNSTQWNVDNYTDSRTDQAPDVGLPAAGCRQPAPEVETQHYLERYEGGTVVKISQRKVINEKSAMVYHTINKNHIRGDREPSIGFSRKSQDNLRTKLGKLNQVRLSKVKAIFLTTTLDGNDHIGQLTTPRQFAKYRNNFLTQLRKRLKGLKYFYVARTERQKRGSLHLHLSIHGVAFINERWVQHTWSRIVLGKAEYEARCIRAELPKGDPDYYPLIRTETKRAKNWGEVKEYFCKDLAYLSKVDAEEQEQAEYIKHSMEVDVWNTLSSEEKKEVLEIKEFLSIGRVWSIGQYDVYDQFVDGKLERIDASEYYQYRRMMVKKRKALWKKQGRCMKKWKEIEKYLLRGKTRKTYKTYSVIIDPLEYDIKMYMEQRDFQRMIDLVRKKVA